MASNTSSGDAPDSGTDSSVSGLDPVSSTPDLSSAPASRPEPADAAPTSDAPASDASATPTSDAPASDAAAPTSDAPASDAANAAPTSDAPASDAPASDAAPTSDVPASDALPVADAEPELPPMPASFDEFSLPDPLRRAIARLGWARPTPVQALSYEPLIAGRDVLVQSHTGSGKTGAFCVPWLASRFDARPASQTGVQMLVLLPTRELAKQVCDELRRLAQETPVDVLPVYGGTPMNPQLAALRAGVHAVVGTPGRILDHIRRRSLDLSKVATVVLDECDEMLSMGFLEDIRAILDQITSKHQTALFSATIPSDVDRIARRYMTEPQSIQLSGDQVAAAEIDHAFYNVSSAIKTRDLLDLIMVEDPARGIVFCNTREETKLVASVLRREGYHAEELSSDLNQTQRERVMKAMREHKIRFLVATDVAARGIDISHVTHVINYSFPESAEVYVHRTGRTGRAGRTGIAVSLISPREIGNFYYLKLQYPSITFHERQLPPAEQLAAERMEFKLDGISKRFPELVSPEWILLARSLMADPRGERVIALLLERAMRAAPRPEPIVDIDAENAAAAAANSADGEQPAAPESAPETRPAGPGEVIEREARDLREHREPREQRDRFGDRDRGDRGRRDRGDRNDRRGRDRFGDRDRPRDGDRRDADRFGERPRDDAPRDADRSADRPRDDRFGDRPRDDRFGDRPRDADRDRSRDDRPRDADRDRPRDDRPRDDRFGERPRDADRDRSRDERPPQSPEGEGAREFSEGREEGRRRRDRRDRRRDRDDRGPRADRPRSDGRPPRTDAPVPVTGEAPATAPIDTPPAAPVQAAPTTPPAPGQIPFAMRGRLGDRGKFLERLTTAPASVAAATPSATGELETGEGRRKRRRKRRRGRRDELDTAPGATPTTTNTAPPSADPELADDDDDDTDDSPATPGTAEAGGEGPDSRRRRRRRRRGRDGVAEARPAPTPPPPPAIVPVPPPRRVSQDEIVIDIDENELAVVSDEFGEIEDEFDEFALMDRRQAVIETLQEEVELEDLSTRDAAAALPIEDDADDAEESDEGDDAETDSETEAEAPTAETTGDAPISGDAPAKKKRRRRRKKAAPLVTPELTAPPHKDFWEVWAGKYTYHDFEDGKFVSPNPVPDEEEPPVLADRPPASARPAPRSELPRNDRSDRSDRPERNDRNDRPERPRRSEPPRRSSEPPRSSPPPRPVADVEDGEYLKVSLNLGRTHGHKAATIRGLLRDHLGLEGRSVRDLTVRDADTLLRIPAGELARVQADVQGIQEGGVTLAIQPAEDEADLRAPQPEEVAALAVAVSEVAAEPASEAAPPAQADDAGTT